MPCALDALHMSFKRAQIPPCTSLWDYDQHFTKTAVITHCSTRCCADAGRKEGGEKSNITLSASLFPCYFISAQIPISAYSLAIRAITLLSATTMAYSFPSAQCLQLLCPCTGISIPLNSYRCLLSSASRQQG